MKLNFIRKDFKMKKHEKTYEILKLDINKDGLINNLNFELLKSSEIIGVKDVNSLKFFEFYIINYYKAPTDKLWRNILLKKALNKIKLVDNSLYVRFTINSIVHKNSFYQICTDEKNIIEVISTYNAFLKVMSVRANYEYLPIPLKRENKYIFENGSYRLKDGTGYFSVEYDLESCDFARLDDEYPSKFSDDFPEVIPWKILWPNEDEYTKELMKIYKNKNVVLYITNPEYWYELHKI